ncbi:acyl-CoA dehydrogenase family protein [Euryhalocaulis caribicus]|uniref:acyl-CoA dehydrogenase family protein n=1 Tax=Euryhalocaulis caribicus TaxID=1161401 RepID=UPI0003A4720B|nr:acyl-CoA dehydrogenase family protein [Euryhalocaulis caribicus]
MTNFRPRADLATHEVANQADPMGDLDAFAGDSILKTHVERALPGGDPDGQAAHLTAFGRETGAQALRELGRVANENPPALKAFDRYGQRIDEVEFHPAYHALMETGLSGGVSARAWTHPAGGHVAHSALMMLMGWSDDGVCCPMSMTYAVVPALKRARWSAEEWAPRVTSAAYDPRTLPAPDKIGATMGMAMTEKQGGSDVRANTTRAEPLDGSDDEVSLTGHKWFCSAPMCDAFLTLAYEEAGLSCFLVPRWTPDGQRNAMEIQRLKDKLGDRSNASSEIEYRGAWARRVGEPGRGVRTIIEMVHHTRLDCIAGSAAQIRRGAAFAVHHAQGRAAFQKKLVDQPLMRAVLSDLSLEAEAATALAFLVAESFDKTLARDDEAAALSRIITPIAKYWICKRAPGAAYEAMEALGGAGYVEESGLPRLFRQSPLNAIWEGSGNVIALDVLRALNREDAAAEALKTALRPAAEAHPKLAEWAAWLADPSDSLAQGEASARAWVERAALCLQAAVLIERAPQDVADAFIEARIADSFLAYGAGTANVKQDVLIERAAVTTA